MLLYSKVNCPQCVQAKALLDSCNIEYSIVLVDQDVSAMEFLRREGHRSVPQVYKDGVLFVQNGYQGLVKLHKAGELK